MSDLTYVGDGKCLVGIPATDLTTEQVDDYAEQRGVTAAELAALLSRSGLYARKPSPKPSAPAEK